MSEDDLGVIFDAFKQVEAGKASGGTGLGLAISLRLARALGGDLEVQSTPGEGSRFTFLLPLEEAEVEPAVYSGPDATPGSSSTTEDSKDPAPETEPPVLPPYTAARLREHLAIRNLTGIAALADELKDDPATEAAGRLLSEWAEAFDFGSMARLAGEGGTQETNP